MPYSPMAAALALCAALALSWLALPASADPGGEPDPPADSAAARRQNLFGSGTWQVACVPDDPGQAELTAIERATWHTVEAPFLLSHAPGIGNKESERVHFAWARRTFTAPPETAYRNAVLHLHGARWGAKVWLNGHLIGQSIGAYGVFEFEVTESLKWGGENDLLIRLTGWPAVEKSREEVPGTNHRRMPLMPHGPALFDWGNRQAGINGGAWIDYFDRARLERVQVITPADGSVTIRGLSRNYARDYGDRVARATVWRGDRKVASAEAQIAKRYTGLSPRTPFAFEMTTRVEKPDLWSPASPTLYRVEVELVQNGRVLDRWSERVGFRTFQARHDGFHLNGRRIFLRGICLWGEAAWWPARMTTDRRLIERYLVDLPRGMNLNAVRHHTNPLDREWLDVADERGMLLLQEFPLTINYRKPELTDEELALYRRRILAEFESMLPLYWNHPSVVIWVESNEPRKELDAFDNGPLYRLFRDADPTRPVMRSGEPSNDIYDSHCYEGFWHGSEGQFDAFAADVLRRGRAAGKPVGNTEYIENLAPHSGRVTKWLGRRPGGVGEAEWRGRVDLYHATAIALQTETLRRLGYDATLPYAMGGGYLGEFRDLDRPAELRANYFALRSAQAPVLASIDLVDRHFAAGGKVDAPIVLCDDTGSGRSFTVTLQVLADDPGFAPPPADAQVLWRKSLTLPEADAPAWRRTVPVAWPMPEKPGQYFLLATVSAPGQEPAVSRRVADVIAAPGDEEVAIAYIGDQQTRADLAKALPGLRAVPLAQSKVLLVGPWAHRNLDALAGVRDFAAGGGAVIVLEQDRPLPPLGLDIPRVDAMGGSSAAFRDGDATFRAWRAAGGGSLLVEGNRALRRLNGPIGAVVRRPLAPADGDEVLLRADQRSGNLDWSVMARRRIGAGEIIFCQIPLHEHLAGPQADPLAVAILRNLLSHD